MVAPDEGQEGVVRKIPQSYDSRMQGKSRARKKIKAAPTLSSTSNMDLNQTLAEADEQGTSDQQLVTNLDLFPNQVSGPTLVPGMLWE